MNTRGLINKLKLDSLPKIQPKKKILKGRPLSSINKGQSILLIKLVSKKIKLVSVLG